MPNLTRLSKVGLETGGLTDDEIKFIDTTIIRVMRPALVGRKIFPIVNAGNAGNRTWRAYAMTDMSQAEISMEGIDESLDHIELANKDVKLPVISKSVKLFWRDLIGSRNGGIPLDTLNIENAARQIAEEEDKLLITGQYTGWGALGIEGLATATGRATQATAGTWGTVANIYTDVSAAIAKLEANGHYGPYAMILRSALKARLRQVNTNTSDLVQHVIEQMLGTGGQVLVSDSLYSSAGAVTSVIVCEPSPDNFVAGIAQDVSTNRFVDNNMNTVLKIYEVIAPRIKRATSICELTGVS
jgi:uncharacterized linocin/CFP29 family protein